MKSSLVRVALYVRCRTEYQLFQQRRTKKHSLAARVWPGGRGLGGLAGLGAIAGMGGLTALLQRFQQKATPIRCSPGLARERTSRYMSEEEARTGLAELLPQVVDQSRRRALPESDQLLSSMNEFERELQQRT